MTSIHTMVLALIAFICIIYICYTRQYYAYCAYAKMNGDYMVNEEVKELFSSLCSDVFKDYSGSGGNSIMRHSLDLIYSFIINPDLLLDDEKEYEKMKAFIKDAGYYSIRFEMKLLKIVHFAFYLVILYLFVIWFPRMIIDLVVYLLDKIFIIMFIVLILEAIFNLYLDLNIDVLKIIYKFTNFIPLNLVGGVLLNIIRDAGGLFFNRNLGNEFHHMH